MAISNINETIRRKSVESNDTYLILAGHLLIIFYCLIFILGFLGNSVVIYVAIRKKKYRNVTNCYVINLALADLLFLTLSIPYTTYLGLVNSSPFGESICRIYVYLAYVFLLATCSTIAAMSIDRCFYIVLPRSKLQWRTPQTAFIICIIIWGSSLVFIVPYHAISQIVTSNSDSCVMSDHDNFLACLFVFCSYYAIPLVIIIIFYTKLAMHIVQTSRLITSHTNTNSVSKSLVRKQRRVTKMVVIVTLAFAICWLPIHILELMKCANSSLLYTLIRSYPKLLYTIRAFTHALAYINSCLNPYLYALLNRNFCADLIDVMPSFCQYYRQSNSNQIKSSPPNTKFLFTSIASPNEDCIRKRHANIDNDDDNTSYYEQDKQIDINNTCQIELLQIN